MTRPTEDRCRRALRCGGLLAWALTLWLVNGLAMAQDLEPRAFSNAPVGVNFLIGGYTYQTGTVGTDVAAPIDDAEVTIHGGILAYVRSFGLLGRSAKFDVVVPYSGLSGSAELAGQRNERNVSGFGDPRFRLSTLLYGGPALTLDEFFEYRQDLIVGASLDVTAPLGQYDATKLVNLGTNRWSIKPQLGISKALGPFTFELIGGVRFYTNNTDFLNNRELEVSPLYTTQVHAIYTIYQGIWASVDGLYFNGARPTVDGERGEANENARIGLTLSLPITPRYSVKLVGSTGVYSKTGTDYDTVGVFWQARWGGGL